MMGGERYQMIILRYKMYLKRRGDITGDIYFDYLRPQNQDPIPYVRLYLMIDDSPESKPVKGLRVLIYGTLAELVFGHVQKCSRIGVEGHI